MNEPQQMTLAEALNILGLSDDVTSSEIKSAFRRLVKTTHPDKPCGSSERFRLLKEAQEIASKSVKLNLPAIVDENQRRMKLIEGVLVAQSAHQQAIREAGKVRRRRTVHLQKMKYTSLILAAVSAVLSWLSDNIFVSIVENSPVQTGILKSGFMIATVSFGTLSGAFHLWIQGIEHSVEGYLEDLGEKQYCAERLALLLKYKDEPKVSHNSLLLENQRDIDVLWLASFTRNVMYNAMNRVLIQKSIEHGLLVDIPPAEISPDSVSQYGVTFKPSRFEPISTNEPKHPEPTISSIREGCLISGSCLVVMFGIYMLLNYYGHTGWAIAALVFAILSAFATIGSLIEWRSAIKKQFAHTNNNRY